MTSLSVDVDTGTVVEVRTDTLGDELTADHAAGVTTLTVRDAVDFDETGGTVNIGGQMVSDDAGLLSITGGENVDYLIAEDDEDNDVGILTLAAPTGLPHIEGDRVWLNPASQEKFAQVMIGNADEAVEVVIPHTLWDKITDGLRADGFGERVALELAADEFTIVDVLGMAPVVDLTFANPDTIPPAPVRTDKLPPAYSPTPIVTPGRGYLTLQWEPVPNPDPATTGTIYGEGNYGASFFGGPVLAPEPVTYDVHISTTSTVPINGSTRVARTPATLITISTMPGGTALHADIPYWVALVARDSDGAAAAGGTVQGIPLNDVEEVTPTAVGAPKITGGVGVLLVSWDPVSNPSSFEVEVYLSATSPVTITPDNLVGTTSATQMMVKELADGTTLSYVDAGGNPVVYYVALRAVNSAGDGPVSAEASGSMHQITGPDVAANYVYAGNLIAGQITGGRLDSEVIVGGDIYALGAGGERVSLSGKGFSVTGPTSAGNPIFVNFPTDGAKPNIFSGTVEANTLDVVNGATLRSDGNHVASKSTLNLSSGVQPPQSPPATDVDWPILDIDTTKRAGILGTFAIDAGDCQGLTWDTVHTRWVTVQNTSKGYRIWRISTAGVTSVESDVSMSGFPAPLIQAYGIVSIAGVTHILDTYFGDWYLNTVTNYTRINPDQWPTLGTDGTNLLVAETVPSTGAVRVRQYNPANLNSITATYTSPDLLPGEGLAGIARGTFDYGATRMITAERYTRVTDFWSMDSTGVHQPNEDWPSVSGNLRGFAWDGTNFWALGSSGNLRQYSTLKWTTESSKWWVSYTWADTDVTSSRTQSVTLNATTTITATAGTFSNADIGSRITASGIPGTTTTITGVLSSAQATISTAATDTSTVTATIFSAAHETPQSPRSSFTMKKRATLTVTTAAMPAGSGAADDPNAVNIYVGRGAGSGSPPDLARTSMFQQSTGPTTLSTAALVFSGTNPPSANNFPSTAPGKIASTGGGFSVDGNADGSPGNASFWRNIFNSLTGGANGRPIQAFNFNTGTYTFTAGSVTIAHGLGTTPAFAAANGNAPRYHFNVTDVDATNMTISCFDDTNAARTGDTTMRWLAIA